MVDFNKHLLRLNQWKELDRDIQACHRCIGLNIPKVTMSAPCCRPSIGRAELLVVGQSLHAYNKNTEPQIPFIGPIPSKDSGKLLYEALTLCGYELNSNMAVTNVVHCHPPDNRSSLPAERGACTEYLLRELSLLQPSIVLALGADARNWFQLPTMRANTYVQFYHRPPSPTIPVADFIIAYHPSYIMRLNSAKAVARYKVEMQESLEKAQYRIKLAKGV